MTDVPPRCTAKIYRFPTRLRVAVPDGTPPGRVAPARLYAFCEAGSGWYHEAAIQDDPRGRKS
ncbi:DUF2735 domain-containing protein [Lichenihabitans sp. Uapishka_5]|uniref:DUF2735 domain-containing protein n=1 Tax=Lichenihabitans sp. Uapishka_5 TaxID=3037302 RepID=UPI0029E802E0|nr:DUF2735 domain-containing protein [Lichenihabitans sp. Uapishka_5]MDX7950147.1 DUF2735 domain-containing protein [Lichenihabitans sp. Uapishka_5]